MGRFILSSMDTFATSFNRLFRNWDDILSIPSSTYALGTPLSLDAFLENRGGKIYLAMETVRRHIVSPAIMDQFCFDWNKVRVNDPHRAEIISEGDPIGTDLHPLS